MEKRRGYSETGFHFAFKKYKTQSEIAINLRRTGSGFRGDLLMFRKEISFEVLSPFAYVLPQAA